MKSKRYLLIGLAAALLLTACGGTQGEGAGDEPAVVTSDDGLARLEIPAGALPAGVELDEISIARLPEGSLELISADADEAIAGDYLAYDLQPSGLEFNQPVTFTLNLSIEDEDGPVPAPLLFHVSGENDELLNPVDAPTVIADLEAGTISVSGDIQSFSKLLVNIAKGIIQANLLMPVARVQIPVNSPVDVHAVITANAADDESSADYGEWFRVDIIPLEGDELYFDNVRIEADLDETQPGNPLRPDCLSGLFGGDVPSNASGQSDQTVCRTLISHTSRVSTVYGKPIYDSFRRVLASGQQLEINENQMICSRAGFTSLDLTVYYAMRFGRTSFIEGDRTGESGQYVIGALQIHSKSFECIGDDESAVTETPTATKELLPYEYGALFRYRCTITIVDDPQGHATYVAMPQTLELTVRFDQATDITITGSGPFIPVMGTVGELGRFEATGRGTAAGFSDVEAFIEGVIGVRELVAEYTLGEDGGLPGGGITYRLECVLIQEESEAEATPSSGESAPTATTDPGSLEPTSTPNAQAAQAALTAGRAFYDQGLLSEALESFNEAIYFDPTFKEAYYNAGVVLFDQGNNEEALEYFLGALQIDPTYDLALFGLGRAYNGLQQWEEELAAWEDFLNNHPQDDDLRTYASQRVEALHAAGYGDD